MTTSSSLPSSAPSHRWTPAADDHLIYRWVKFEGYTQSQVAQMLNISQPTVSRVIQRYERWQAHMKNREGGRLDARERLRAQRWLTYERNELILASCLRIAEEMERSTELSKTTIRRPINEMQPRELRTEQRVVDRHGVAARFLRLAFRVNMEQLELTDLIARDGEVPAEPLTDEELAAELRQAAADAAELAAARHPAADLCSRHTPCDEPTTAQQDNDSLPESTLVMPERAGPPSPDESPEPSAAVNTVNNLNNVAASETAASPHQHCNCVLQVSLEKNAPCTCIIDPEAPPSPDNSDQMLSKRRAEPGSPDRLLVSHHS